MKVSSVNVRIEPELKHDAEAILHEIGLSSADAVRILYRQICLRKGLPFEVKLPSASSQAAIDELESGKGHKHKDFKSLLDD
ncbi:type II toxin-antitoxin system RelB/DinJ family antitoxin [Francisellaceae bacterium]|nr:type II toxin-antitoxin system RelB/DinJ family antitoxin [Francisellaceae bacterium]